MKPLDRRLADAIGRAVYFRRLSLEWTQAELARELGSSEHYVALIERSERIPSSRMLARLGRTLGLSFAELCDSRAPAPPEPRIVTLARAIPEESRKAVEQMLKGVIDGERRKSRRSQAIDGDTGAQTQTKKSA